MIVLLAALLLTPGAQAGTKSARLATLTAPLDAEVWADLGEAYLKSGKKKAAQKAFARALALDAGNARAREAQTELGGMRAAKLERRALRHPDDDEIWGDLADRHAAMGNTDQALMFYMYAMRLDPADSEWQRRIGEVGGPDAMINMMEEMIASGNANDETIGDVGDLFWERGEAERACELWQEASARDPSDGEWTDKLAMNCGIGGYGGYEEPYYDDGYIEGGEPYPEDYGVLGSLLGGGGGSYWGGADNLGNGGLPPDPGPGGLDLGSSGDAEVLAAMGRARLLAGDNEAALDMYERSLAIEPTNADALHAVMVLTRQTRLQILEKLVDQVPGNDELYGDLGDTYLSAGDHEAAIGAYERALEIDPSDTEWQQKILVLRHEDGGAVDLSPK